MTSTAHKLGACLAVAAGLAALPALVVLAPLGCGTLLGIKDVPNPGAEVGAGQESGTDDDGSGDAGGCLVCAPAPPAGWSGPVALFDSTGSPPPGSPCTGAYPLRAFAGSAKPTFAGACSCACVVSTPPTCSSVVSATFHTGACPGPDICGGADASPGTCLDTSGCGAGSLYVSAGPIVPTGGACAATPDPLPGPSWSEVGQACALAAPATRGLCDAGQVCLPAPPPTFGDAICVLRSGSMTCPEAYPVQHIYFASFDDTRSCGCSCGAPLGSCPGTIHVFAAAGCTTPTVTVGLTEAGCDFAAASSSPVELEYTVQGASCAAAAGLVDGGVTGASPTTVCCTH